MNDILISCLMFDGVRSHFRGTGSYNNWYNGVACGVTRSDTGVPTYIVSGLIHEVNVLRIAQGDTPETRIVGLKLGTNPDGSYKIRLLANNVPYRSNRKWSSYALVGGVSDNAPTQIADATFSAEMITTPVIQTGALGMRNNTVHYASYNVNSFASTTNSQFRCENGREELPGLLNYISDSNKCNIELQGDGFSSQVTTSLKITTDKDTSIGFGFKNAQEMGHNISRVFVDNWYNVKYGQIDPMIGLTGNTYDFICEMMQKIQPTANAQISNLALANRDVVDCPGDYLHYEANDFYFGTSYDNLHITSSYEQAIAYLNTGAIPDDDEYRERNPDNPEPYDGEPQPPTPPEPPEGQIENSDDSIDAGTDAEYGASTDISLPGLNWYNLHKSVLSGFINWFWNDMTDWGTVLINSITGLYGNMQNCVISIKKMHVAEQFLFDNVDYNANIKLGRYTYVSGGANYSQQINSAPNKMKDVGSYTLSDTDNIYGFLDYSPYTAISIYLPYVGIVPIDTRYVRGRTITVQCAASYETGEIMYCVKCGPYKVGYYSGKASIEVPFSLESGMQIASNTVNALGNIGASVAMGGALGATNLLGQDISAPTNINSSVTSALMRYGHTKCALIVQRPQHYKLYDVAQGKTVNDYAHVNGYKYNCVRTCHLGEGYAVFDNPHIDTWNTSPTDAEVDEIYSLMKEGIVL